MNVPELHTDRLTLRAFRASDADDVFEACKNPKLGNNAGWPPHQSVEDSLDYINVIAPMGYVWAILEKDAPRVIGSIGLLADPRTPDDESTMLLGYWLAEDKWSRGYTTEASKAILDWGFSEAGLSKVTTCHFLHNHASRRVIEKCGFAATHIAPWEGDDPNEPNYDSQWYELEAPRSS